MRRITNEVAVDRIRNKGFELLTEYTSHDDPITLKCKCGKISSFEKASATWGGRRKICDCNYNDLTGKTFGRLYVNFLHTEKSKKNEKLWDCDCECGNKRFLTGWDLTSKRYSSCGCYRNDCISNRKFEGYEKIRATYFNIIRRGAEYRGLSFNVTIEEIWDLFKKQGEKCALTGKKLEIQRLNKHRKAQTASLDRIDSTKGYEKDNIQWVHKDINRFKNSFSEQHFLEMVKEIYEFKILGKEPKESFDKNEEIE